MRLYAALPLPLLLVGLPLLGFSLTFGVGQEPQAEAAAKPFQPYHYKTIEVEGWTVLVQKELDRKQDLREQVLKLLDIKLWEIATRLPADVVARLRQVPLRIHLDRPGNPGAAYHPSSDWLREHGFPEDWAGTVEFGNAEHFLSWSKQQPAMVLHELAHAWHHQVLGYGQEAIRASFAATKAAGTIDQVLYVTGGMQDAYALNNEQEFFAEMSEAWWWTNDMYPFVRSELAAALPEVGAQMEAWWRLP